LELLRRIEENQKELDYLTNLMEEYEACVQLSIKRHNRKVKYYRKKHEEELAAAAKAEKEKLEQQNEEQSENESNDENNPNPSL
jgi:predicted AAA+ superfamily ATPase